MRRLALLSFAWLMLATAANAVLAEVVARKVDIYSEGVRMTGTLYHDRELAGRKLPTVILSHGWGGTASMLRPEAERFAQAGYLALAFDYRGWGESDARWVRDDGAAGAQARRELREVVDPIDQATDVLNAIHWVMGEPAADAKRVGLWGTSFSGGLVAYAAARDPRIRATVSQVAAFGMPRSRLPPELLSRAEAEATKRARGEIGYPAPGAREVGNLYGAPIRESFLRYAPIDDIPSIRHCAMLIIDAENEELFDIRQHGALAFERASEPKKRVVIPGIAHYGIYGSAREQAIGLAVDWMNQHLKGPD